MADNPNQPRYPYGGGTDNPSESTAYTNPGGPTNVAATETAPLTHGNASLASIDERFPPVVHGISQAGTDTTIVGVVPEVASGVESAVDIGGDTGGPTVDPITGRVRVSGQDETVGETETTTGITPTAFPEPNQ